MVAYNFQKQFVAPIEAGTKIHTMRLQGKRRHASLDDRVHLYTGLRHPGAKLIRVVTCTHQDFLTIRLPNASTIGEVAGVRRVFDVKELQSYTLRKMDDLHVFARNDGFGSWGELVNWIRSTHKPDGQFECRLIGWGSPAPYLPPPAP